MEDTNVGLQEDKKLVELVKVKIEFTTIKKVKQREDSGGGRYGKIYKEEEVDSKEVISNKEVSKEVHLYLDKNGNYYEDPYDYYFSIDREVYDDVTEGNAHGAVELYDKMFVYQFYVDEFPTYKNLHEIATTMAKAVSEIDMALDIEDGHDIVQETLNGALEEHYGVDMKDHDDEKYREEIHEHFEKQLKTK